MKLMKVYRMRELDILLKNQSTKPKSLKMQDEVHSWKNEKLLVNSKYTVLVSSIYP